jgi:predicted nucleic acid-binding protein
VIGAVMDCSAVVELLTGGLEAIVDNDELAECVFVAPHLIDPEFLHVMRRRILQRPDQAQQIERMMTNFRRLQIIRMEHEPLWQEAWRWRDNLSPYDAMYVAVAHHLDLPLVTADERLAAAAERWCTVRRLSELQAA